MKISKLTSICVLLISSAYVFVSTALASLPQGFPTGWKEVSIVDIKDDGIQNSINVIKTKSMEEIVSAEDVSVFPSISTLRQYIITNSEDGVNKYLIYGTPELKQKIDSYLINNPGNKAWYEGLSSSQKRGVCLLLRWNWRFTLDVATESDLQNDDILYNVIGINIFNKYAAKTIKERCKITDAKLLEYQEKVFDYCKSSGVVYKVYQEYFVERLVSKTDAEVISIVKTELNGLISNLDPTNEEQVKWINKLRYILKIKTETK